MFTNSAFRFITPAAILLATSVASAGTVEIINPSGTVLTPPVGQPSISYDFGVDVAVSDGKIAVGAPAVNNPEDPTGRVFLFDQATGAFTREIVPPATAPSIVMRDFGERIALDSDVLVVTDYDRSPLFADGEVFVYDAQTGAFLFELASFGDGVENSGSIGYGTDIAVGSGIIAVGQPFFASDAGEFLGAVFLYDAATGAPIDRLIGPDTPSDTFEFFGVSVAIHGDVIAVGRAPVGVGGAADAPQDAFLFNAHTLAMTAHILPPMTMDTDDNFGAEIALNGDTLVVCAPGDDSFGQGSGSAYTYDVATGAYRNTLALVHPTGPEGRLLRMNAEISESGLIAISSPDNGDAAPAVRLFDDQTGTHVASLEVTSMTTDSEFGFGLAFAGNTVYAGNTASFFEESDSVFAFVTGSTITQHPASYVTDVENDPHVFSVAATNPTGFQWFKDGVPVVDGSGFSGAMTDSLTVLANTSTEGEYVCEVTSVTGAVTLSDPAYLVFQGSSDTSCPSDFDNDGSVDSFDLSVLLAAWGLCPE